MWRANLHRESIAIVAHEAMKIDNLPITMVPKIRRDVFFMVSEVSMAKYALVHVPTMLGFLADPSLSVQGRKIKGYKHTLLSDQHRAVCMAMGIHWADMNTTQRATVIIAKDAGGTGKVKFIQTREPGKGMTWDQVLAVIA
jgi:hypothetical protein